MMRAEHAYHAKYHATTVERQQYGGPGTVNGVSDTDETWHYRVVNFKTFEVRMIEERLNAYGRAGWELVGLSTTVKKVGNLAGNDLVAILKRRGSGVRGPEPEADTVDGWM